MTKLRPREFSSQTRAMAGRRESKRGTEVLGDMHISSVSLLSQTGSSHLEKKPVLGASEARPCLHVKTPLRPTGPDTSGPVVKTPNFHCKGVWVTSLAGEPRSHLLLMTKKKSAFAEY